MASMTAEVRARPRRFCGGRSRVLRHRLLTGPPLQLLPVAVPLSARRPALHADALRLSTPLLVHPIGVNSEAPTQFPRGSPSRSRGTEARQSFSPTSLKAGHSHGELARMAPLDDGTLDTTHQPRLQERGHLLAPCHRASCSN